MRLGVLDIGSNTIHLLVVDAYSGAPPVPMKSLKTTLKLATLINNAGSIPKSAVNRLSSLIEEYTQAAKKLGCDELMTFATSAIREAHNGDEVLENIKKKTGVDIRILSGVDEAKVTYLAVRRWFGWAAGRILALDIGGGSVEISVGANETPEYAVSLPIGTGRVLKKFDLSTDPKPEIIPEIQNWLSSKLQKTVDAIKELEPVDIVVGTSKTFRLLTQIAESTPLDSSFAKIPTVTSNSIIKIGYFLSRMKVSDIAQIDGVRAERAELVIPGAQIATALLHEFEVPRIMVCPWALREGLILRKTDSMEQI